MVRPEAGVDGQHALKAGEEQAGAGQQHERERHLRDDEAAPQQARAAAARPAPSLFPEHGRHRGRNEPPRRE